MKAIIDGRQATLTKSDLIAQGGEGMIFKDPNNPRSRALKIYHQPTKERADKLKAFFKAGLTLPDSVIAPMEMVTDEKGKIIGFQMKWLSSRHSRISMVFKKSFCRDHGLDTKTKVGIFSGIGNDLNEIHHQGLNIGPGLIVGDLNGGSVMLHEENLGRAWVDVDSWQLNEKFPCVVGTQLYLCPELYGIDLSKATLFKAEHDWWSYTVLLVQALLNGVHPFKSGKHPDYISVLARAEHGATVFDDDVAYPKIGLSPDVLTDDLANIIIKILKRQEIGAFPKDELKAYSDVLVECHSCGIWYPATRGNCPGCTQKTMLDTSMKILVAGLQVVDLIITGGRILCHQKVGDTLYCIADEAGQLVLYTKESGKVAKQLNLNKATPPGARFRFFDGLIVICPDPGAQSPRLEVYEIESGGLSLITETTTEPLSGGRAIFGCSPKRLYRIAGRYIMCGQRIGSNLIERQVLQGFEGQTFFKVATEPFSSRDIVFGCHREFDQLNWFLVRADNEAKIFTRYGVDLPPLSRGESIADVAIYFSREEILVVRKTRKKGIDFIRLETVSTEDGSVKSSRQVELNDCLHWDNIHGKAFSLDLVMHSTDDGIVKERISDGSINDLPGTDQYVTSDDSLGRFERGVMVIKDESIVSIEPKKK